MTGSAALGSAMREHNHRVFGGAVALEVDTVTTETMESTATGSGVCALPRPRRTRCSTRRDLGEGALLLPPPPPPPPLLLPLAPWRPSTFVLATCVLAIIKSA